jgi:hypothetical protein
MNNASIVKHVVEQLVTDNLVVTKTDGELTKHSAQALGAAATSLAIAMQKDRVKMFRHMRTLSLRRRMHQAART